MPLTTERIKETRKKKKKWERKWESGKKIFSVLLPLKKGITCKTPFTTAEAFAEISAKSLFTPESSFQMLGLGQQKLDMLFLSHLLRTIACSLLLLLQQVEHIADCWLDISGRREGEWQDSGKWKDGGNNIPKQHLYCSLKASRC